MTLLCVPQTLLAYCAHGDHDAHKERMIREIMNVDNIDWDRANVSNYPFPFLTPSAGKFQGKTKL